MIVLDLDGDCASDCGIRGDGANGTRDGLTILGATRSGEDSESTWQSIGESNVLCRDGVRRVRERQRVREGVIEVHSLQRSSLLKGEICILRRTDNGGCGSRGVVCRVLIIGTGDCCRVQNIRGTESLVTLDLHHNGTGDGGVLSEGANAAGDLLTYERTAWCCEDREGGGESVCHRDALSGCCRTQVLESEGVGEDITGIDLESRGSLLDRDICVLDWADDGSLGARGVVPCAWIIGARDQSRVREGCGTESLIVLDLDGDCASDGSIRVECSKRTTDRYSVHRTSWSRNKGETVRERINDRNILCSSGRGSVLGNKCVGEGITEVCLWSGCTLCKGNIRILHRAVHRSHNARRRVIGKVAITFERSNNCCVSECGTARCRREHIKH